VAAVHVCADVTQIVVGRGGDVELVRKVDLGTAQLEAAVARKLGVTTQEARELRRRAGAAPVGDPVREAVLDATRAPAEDLAREVGLCLRYHAAGFRCAPPPCVRLLGPGAGDPHLAAVIASAVAVPVDAGSVFRSVDAGGVPGRDAADGAWAVAVGLALKALEPAAPSARAVVAAGPVREPVHA
jgi:Tfp pilus assembly PilM family ATPase